MSTTNQTYHCNIVHDDYLQVEDTFDNWETLGISTFESLEDGEHHEVIVALHRTQVVELIKQLQEALALPSQV